MILIFNSIGLVEKGSKYEQNKFKKN